MCITLHCLTVLRLFPHFMSGSGGAIGAAGPTRCGWARRRPPRARGRAAWSAQAARAPLRGARARPARRSPGATRPRARPGSAPWLSSAFSPDGRPSHWGRRWSDPVVGRARRQGTSRFSSPRKCCQEYRLLGRQPPFSVFRPGCHAAIVLSDAVRGVSIRPLGMGQVAINPVSISAFSPDGRTVAVGEVGLEPEDVTLLDSETDTIVARLTGHRAGVHAWHFPQTAAHWQRPAWFPCIKLWDVAKRKELTTFSTGVGIGRSITFSNDGAWLALGAGQNTVRIWESPPTIVCARSSPDGQSPKQYDRSDPTKLTNSGFDNGSRPPTLNDGVVSSL